MFAVMFLCQDINRSIEFISIYNYFVNTTSITLNEFKIRFTFRIGSEDINVITAIRLFGKTNCPFGLFISEQTWEPKYGEKIVSWTHAHVYHTYTRLPQQNHLNQIKQMLSAQSKTRNRAKTNELGRITIDFWNLVQILSWK